MDRPSSQQSPQSNHNYQQYPIQQQHHNDQSQFSTHQQHNQQQQETTLFYQSQQSSSQSIPPLSYNTNTNSQSIPTSIYDTTFFHKNDIHINDDTECKNDEKRFKLNNYHQYTLNNTNNDNTNDHPSHTIMNKMDLVQLQPPPTQPLTPPPQQQQTPKPSDEQSLSQSLISSLLSNGISSLHTARLIAPLSAQPQQDNEQQTNDGEQQLHQFKELEELQSIQLTSQPYDVISQLPQQSQQPQQQQQSEQLLQPTHSSSLLLPILPILSTSKPISIPTSTIFTTAPIPTSTPTSISNHIHAQAMIDNIQSSQPTPVKSTSATRKSTTKTKSQPTTRTEQSKKEIVTNNDQNNNHQNNNIEDDNDEDEPSFERTALFIANKQVHNGALFIDSESTFDCFCSNNSIDQSISCDSCGLWFHIDCFLSNHTNITNLQEEKRKLLESKLVFCQYCLTGQFLNQSHYNLFHYLKPFAIKRAKLAGFKLTKSQLASGEDSLTNGGFYSEQRPKQQHIIPQHKQQLQQQHHQQQLLTQGHIDGQQQIQSTTRSMNKSNQSLNEYDEKDEQLPKLKQTQSKSKQSQQQKQQQDPTTTSTSTSTSSTSLPNTKRGRSIINSEESEIPINSIDGNKNGTNTTNNNNISGDNNISNTIAINPINTGNNDSIDTNTHINNDSMNIHTSPQTICYIMRDEDDEDSYDNDGDDAKNQTNVTGRNKRHQPQRGGVKRNNNYGHTNNNNMNNESISTTNIDTSNDDGNNPLPRVRVSRQSLVKRATTNSQQQMNQINNDDITMDESNQIGNDSTLLKPSSTNTTPCDSNIDNTIINNTDQNEIDNTTVNKPRRSKRVRDAAVAALVPTSLELDSIEFNESEELSISPLSTTTTSSTSTTSPLIHTPLWDLIYAQMVPISEVRRQYPAIAPTQITQNGYDTYCFICETVTHDKSLHATHHESYFSTFQDRLVLQGFFTKLNLQPIDINTYLNPPQIIPSGNEMATTPSSLPSTTVSELNNSQSTSTTPTTSQSPTTELSSTLSNGSTSTTTTTSSSPILSRTEVNTATEMVDNLDENINTINNKISPIIDSNDKENITTNKDLHNTTDIITNNHSIDLNASNSSLLSLTSATTNPISTFCDICLIRSKTPGALSNHNSSTSHKRMVSKKGKLGHKLLPSALLATNNKNNKLDTNAVNIPGAVPLSLSDLSYLKSIDVQIPSYYAFYKLCWLLSKPTPILQSTTPSAATMSNVSPHVYSPLQNKKIPQQSISTTTTTTPMHPFSLSSSIIATSGNNIHNTNIHHHQLHQLQNQQQQQQRLSPQQLISINPNNPQLYHQSLQPQPQQHLQQSLLQQQPSLQHHSSHHSQPTTQYYPTNPYLSSFTPTLSSLTPSLIPNLQQTQLPPPNPFSLSRLGTTSTTLPTTNGTNATNSNQTTVHTTNPFYALSTSTQQYPTSSSSSSTTTGQSVFASNVPPNRSPIPLQPIQQQLQQTTQLSLYNTFPPQSTQLTLTNPLQQLPLQKITQPYNPLAVSTLQNNNINNTNLNNGHNNVNNNMNNQMLISPPTLYSQMNSK